MNDKKFVNSNRTGVFKRMDHGKISVPKEIRESNELKQDSMVEIIPMFEGFYIRKARTQEKKKVKI